MIISYDNKTPFSLFMEIRVGLCYLLLLSLEKSKWVSSYTLKGQQKDLSFICMTK